MFSSVLVAYASKSGATVEVAEALGRTLGRYGAMVDIKPMREVARLDGYRGIVLGSAIRNGHWLPEGTAFVNQFQAELYVIPTAIFTVHLFNLDDSVESTANRWAYTAPVYKLFRPVAETFFAGRLKKSKLELFEKVTITATKTPDQDQIDWKQIRAWGEQIAPLVGAN